MREFPAGRQPRNGIGLDHDLVAVENDDEEGIRHMSTFTASVFGPLLRSAERQGLHPASLIGRDWVQAHRRPYKKRGLQVSENLSRGVRSGVAGTVTGHGEHPPRTCPRVRGSGRKPVTQRGDARESRLKALQVAAPDPSGPGGQPAGLRLVASRRDRPIDAYPRGQPPSPVGTQEGWRLR